MTTTSLDDHTTPSTPQRFESTRPGRSGWLGAAVIALVAYVPALASAPGRMPADTKLYLYLDPGGLLARAGSTFERDQFAGWVPHQQIAYLWPSGPWYWLFDAIGVPDWIAQRLWIATVLFLAGLGVRWTARLLQLGEPAATVAGLVYLLSPFVLAYISRTSLLLLPWAGLGWIVGLTIRACVTGAAGPSVPRWRARLGTWRDPALIALVVGTIGAINATAVLLIVPAPLLWLLHATANGMLPWRRAVAIAARVAVSSLVVSLWWIAMLVVQARHGAAVLSFSETLEDVSRNSTGSEVLRSLGYWLFYQRNPVGPTTTASLPYLISSAIIAVSFVTVIAALAALTLIRWTHRRFAAVLVATGAILAVGVHPLSSPSPLMALLVDDDESGLALALRSSTRAMPVMGLGVAIAIAAGIAALAGRQVRPRRLALPLPWLAAAAVVVVLVAAMPAFRGADLVDPAIDRDEDPPAWWTEAAARVDARHDDGRVLQLPGAEFGAFRWGYTADQPLVGLADTPLVTRDLLPLGSPAAMDLLFAFDDRLQEGTLEPNALAAVARLLGVETVLLANDIAFDRYDLARPEIVDAQLADRGTPGIGDPERLGPPSVNVPEVPMVDPTSLADPRVGAPLSPLTLLPVDDAAGVHRARTASVVVSGSGDGIVDAAAAGLLTGNELVRYSASLDEDRLTDAIGEASAVIITDGNRDRAHHWRGSQDVVGHTEPGGPDDDVLVATNADQRLGMFATDDPSAQTIAVQEGPVTAIASSYGEPFAYRPEDRAVMAIDGDPSTAWSVADHGDPVGEHIRLRLDRPLASDDTVTLHQTPPPTGGRVITGVRIASHAADAVAADVELDERSWTQGQTLGTAELGASRLAGATVIDVEITAVSTGDPAVAASRRGVGFAEIDLGRGPTTEYVRPPIDVVGSGPATALGEAVAERPLAFVLSRLRTSATDPWRSDPEPQLLRTITLPAAREVDVTATLRLDRRAADGVLAELFAGARTASPAVADRRLTGAPGASGAAALDGDPDTAWMTPFDDAVGARLTVPIGEGFDGRIIVSQPVGSHSVIRRVTVAGADGADVAEVSLDPDPSGRSTITVPADLAGAELTLTIEEIDAVTTVDRRYGDVVTLPAAISELDGAGLVASTLDPSEVIEVGCGDEMSSALLAIDGEPIPLQFRTTAGALLAGEPVTATACDGALTLVGGEHRVEGVAERALTVDRVVLDAGVGEQAVQESSDIAVDVSRDDQRARDVTVAACPDGCWLVLGEGHNDAWSATAEIDGQRRDLGAPELVDGGFNGWRLPPTETPTLVEIRWTAQGPVTWGLVVALLGAATLVTVVIFGRRRPVPSGWSPAPRLGWSTPSPARIAAASAIALVVATGVFVSPLWSLLALPVAAAGWLVAARHRRLRVMELVGLGAAVATAIAVVVIERRDQPIPNAGWTLAFDHLNGLALFGLLAVAVGAAFGSDARGE